MKTAIIIIPTIGQNIDSSMYLSSCANRVRLQGYTVLHSTSWSDYHATDMKRLAEKLDFNIDAFFMFVDCGISIFMIDIINRFYINDENGPRFLKEIKIEASLNVKQVNLNGILFDISQKSRIPIETLKAKTRKREVVEARQIYFKRAKELTTSSLASIGELVGRDHATVLHGIKTVGNVKELGQLYKHYFNGGPSPYLLRLKASKPDPEQKEPGETPVIKAEQVNIIVDPPTKRISTLSNIQTHSSIYHGYFEHAL